MPAKRYRVTLTVDERQQLQQRLAAGRAAARSLLHARVLLKADESAEGPAWTDEQICVALEVSDTTVERIRRRFVEDGLDIALGRKPTRRVYQRKLDGAQEAQLIALACSPPPLGRRQWSLRLLADRLVELRFIDGVSYETVRQVLKKTFSSPG
jgi:transposase